MSYREKAAWLTLLTMAVAYSIYFILLAGRLQDGPPAMVELIWMFGAVAGTQAIVVLLLHIALRLRSGAESRAPADERDRAIARHGTSRAYYVMLAGLVIVGVVMPFGSPHWKIVNTAFLVIVMAEAVRLITIVRSYRGGWHG